MDPDVLLANVLPGAPAPPHLVRATRRRAAHAAAKLPEDPWRFWESGGSVWAIYLAGSRISKGAIASIAALRGAGVSVAILAKGNDDLKAAAQHFMSADSHLLCEIAGEGTIIPPIKRGPKPPPLAWPSRVPKAVIDELRAERGLPLYLRRALHDLAAKYDTFLRKGVDSDTAEQRALSDYAVRLLRHMGFRGANANIDAAQMVRRLELSGWGGRRDHFFHSFQNYFFGLYATAKLTPHFDGSFGKAKLNWTIDPFDVWFLTALWHDVGYGIEKFDRVAADIFGDVLEDDFGSDARIQFLNSDICKEATRSIGSLIARLLNADAARTAWMQPVPGAYRSRVQTCIEKAIRDNVMESHGAASALRLYSECIPMTNRLGPENSAVLRQKIFLACASAPFHDWHFRQCLRCSHGTCKIPTAVMPFAALLAFVDSIQDDRRDLKGLTNEINFLKTLIVNRSVITAEVELGAISDESILWKVVEARDIVKSLHQVAGAINFEYPNWMVN